MANAAAHRGAERAGARCIIKGGAWWARSIEVRAGVEPRAVHRGRSGRGIPVFAVGGIRTAAERARSSTAAQADMVGIGRPFYAEPDLAARVLGADAAPRLCRNSNRCVPAQMLGMKGACYNPEVKKRAILDLLAQLMARYLYL